MIFFSTLGGKLTNHPYFMKKITLLFAFFLFFAESRAQAVSSYLLSQSTEAYVSLAGTSSTAIDDDGIQNNIPIGFNFNLGGDSHTTFSISTNGWIRLGAAIGGNSWINTLANTNDNNTPLIAAFWDDHNPSPGDIKYATSGIIPNRVLEVEWNNVSISTGGAINAAATGSFKMRLHETTGIIEFGYGSITPGPQLSASIGLNQAGSFLSVTPTSTATASSTTANNNINSTAFLTGTKYTLTPSLLCSGTPVPGDTQAVATAVCSNDIIQLSISNTINEFGISYQWQSSTNGTDYANIDGAFSPTLQLTQSETTYYRCMVSCGANSAESTPILITSNPLSACYCSPTYTNGKTDGDLISNVVIVGTTLANDTGTAPVNPSYTFFTGQPNYTATLQSGFAYAMNVTVGTYQQQNVSVWIDYNDDTIFTEEERIGYSEEIGSNGTGVFTIALACDAPVGEHRMRVRDVWNTDASTLSPCDNYGYGETEDYNITIVAASECQTPQNLTADNISTLSIALSWTAGCSQLWDVYVMPAGSPAPTDSTVPTAASLVTNSVLISNLLPNTAYDFYVRTFCGANGNSPWSPIPLTVSTLPLAVLNDECAGATVLVPGASFEQNVVEATNVGATKTLNAPNPTCGIFGFGGDVWFSVVVPADGNITIEVQQDPGSPLNDTAMTAFSGTCDNLVTLGCSDDEGVGAFSRLNLTGLTPGETIFARVWEYANDVFGTFQVSAWNPAILQNAKFDDSSFKYHPNPVKDVLNLSYDKIISEVSIFNLLGQQVLYKELNSNQAQVNLSNLPNGAYFVNVVSENKSKTIKIIKE